MNPINNVDNLVTRLGSIGNIIVYLLVSLAVIYIVYYTVQYFIRGEEGKDHGAAAIQILWGIIGLAIIVSLWGLVNILTNTFNTNRTLQNGTIPNADFTAVQTLGR